MTNFEEKKQELVMAFNEFLQNSEIKTDFMNYILMVKKYSCFENNQLFQQIFDEITENINDMSRKDIKQRLLMIESFE